MVVVAQAARLVVDDVLEPRQPLRDRQDLVDLLLVLDHRERDLGMLEHVGHLVGDRVRLDRHRHAAEHLRGRHRPVEPRPVVADDGDLVAALEPELSQADAQGAHLVAHLAQVQVCQMPRSLWRIAGRSACSRALRISSLGNVSGLASFATAGNSCSSAVLPKSRPVELSRGTHGFHKIDASS